MATPAPAAASATAAPPRGVQILQRPDGGEQHRGAQRAPQQGRRAVDPGHIAQHPWPECDGVECLAVAPQRGLRLRASHEVVPDAFREPAPRLLDDLVKGGEVVGVLVHASALRIHSSYGGVSAVFCSEETPAPSGIMPSARPGAAPCIQYGPGCSLQESAAGIRASAGCPSPTSAARPA